MEIIAFGIVAEMIGSSKIYMDFVSDSEQLKELLYEQFPLLKTINFAISVNRKIIHANTALDANSEVALLPPFSGG